VLKKSKNSKLNYRRKKMKKLFVLLLAAGYCLAGIAAEPTSSWILSKSGKMNMKSISFGISNARIVLESGKVLKLPIDQLSSYSVDGKIFNKMPLYKYGRTSGEMVFMQLIGKQGELSLYRYDSFNFDAVNPHETVSNYAIYNGDKLHLALTDKTLPNVCKYFGLQLTYK
jgi:hypothetical protein